MADQINGYLSGYLRKKRFDIIKPYLYGNILDFGCGIGMLSSSFEINKYVGIDIDKESIRIAKHNNPTHNFFCLNDFDYIYDFAPFDIVIMLAVIEHLKNPIEILKKLNTLLNKNGNIILTTPSPISNKIHYIGSIIGLFSKSASKEHKKLYSLNDIINISIESKFKVAKYKKFLFSLNQLFILEKE